MAALENAMRAGPVDVFWFQERWKVYLRPPRSIADWLGPAGAAESTPLRALLWLTDMPAGWVIPATWVHPAVVYEVVLTNGQEPPGWLAEATRIHTVPVGGGRDTLRKAIAGIDAGAVLPLDFILTTGASKGLVKAGRRESVPVISLP